MPLPPVVVNVPIVPGVPPVGVVATAQTLLTALTQDLVSQFSAVFGPQWGIFLGGAPIIVADSVASFEFRKDWTIADYPIEGGLFETYDKVQTPFLGKVRFSQGGTTSERANFLANIAAVAGTFVLYDIVTPEIVYLNVTISHYDYRRTATNGLGLIVVDVWVSEVLVQNMGGLSAANVQNPGSADANNNGTVQPQTPPASAPPAS